MALRNLNVKLKLDASNFRKGLKKSERQLKNYSRNVNAVSNTILKNIALPFALGSAAAIKMASDYEESVNKVDVAFKDSATTVKDWSKTTIEAFGISSGAALDAAAMFGDMATSMGVGTKNAADMSMNLVGLAGDMASFKNIGIDIAQTALASIFTGETESLKKMGIVMTEVNLQEFARSKGIDKSIKKMGQQEKVMLRYNFILDKTKNAQGDFARTGGGAANQMRIFTEQLKEVALGFGQLLLPMFTRGIKKVNSFVTMIRNLDDKTKANILSWGAWISSMGLGLKAASLLIGAFGNMQGALAKIITFTKQATGAQEGFSRVAKASAIGLVVAGIAAAVYVYQKFNAELKKLKKNLTNATVQIKEEEIAANDLFKAIKSNNTGYGEKKTALEELQRLYPNLLTNINVETSTLEDLKIAQDDVNKSIRERIVLEMKSEALKEIQQKIIRKELELQDALADRHIFSATHIGNLKIELDNLKSSFSATNEGFDKLMNAKGDGGAGGGLATIKGMNEEARNLNLELKKTKGILAPDITTTTTTTPTGGGGEKRDKRVTEKLDTVGFGEYLASYKALNDEALQFLETEDLSHAAAVQKKEDFENLVPAIDGVTAALDRNELKTHAINQAIGAFGSAFGEIMGAAGKSATEFAAVFKKAAISLVANLIQIGVAAAVSGSIKAASALGPFAVAIGAAAGLAASSLFTGIISSLSPPALAEGGLAYGTTLATVGDNPNARVDPEVIAPLSKLKGIMGGGSQNNITLKGEFITKGNDLVLVIDRTRQIQSRI